MPAPSFFTSDTGRLNALALNPQEQEELVAFLQKLVQTPSYSTCEGEVAALIEEKLRAIGIHDVRIDRIGNVIARIGSGDGPTLLYDAHMDTVSATEADWPHPPHAGVIEDGVLYGLGACDMKGSLAAMIFAAKRLIESGMPLQGTLVLAFVVQEEPCEGCALKVMIEQEGIRPDWVVLGEPSDLDVMRGQRGRVLFRVTVRGRSSHASNPQLGVNAVAAAARLVFGIDLLSADLPQDPFLGSSTIAVTHIESQAPSFNAIPDTCTLYVDRRLTLGETPTRALAQLEGVVERESIPASIEIVEYHATSYTGNTIGTREAFNAWVLDEEHPLLKTLSSVARSVLGHAPSVGHWPFSTDGVYSMGEANIPTVGFGPGSPHLAHTVDEHVRLDDVIQAAQVYAVLAARLLGPE